MSGGQFDWGGRLLKGNGGARRSGRVGFGVALAGDGHAAAHGFGPQIAVPLAGLREARGQGAGGAGKDGI